MNQQDGVHLPHSSGPPPRIGETSIHAEETLFKWSLSIVSPDQPGENLCNLGTRTTTNRIFIQVPCVKYGDARTPVGQHPSSSVMNTCGPSRLRSILLGHQG